MQKVAIMVDGGFFVKRLYSELGYLDADTAAKFLMKYCLSHLKAKGKMKNQKPYIVFFIMIAYQVVKRFLIQLREKPLI